jgi:uncharacterized membrane protein
MNRSFLIIFIPALLVAAMYLALGYRPPTRVEIGLAVFVAAIAAYRLKAMLDIRKADIRKAKSSSAPVNS